MRMNIRVLLALTVAALNATLASADDWRLRIASWNLRNMGDIKAGIDPPADSEALLDRYAEIISQFDIVFLEEILNDGRSVTEAIKATGPPFSQTRQARNQVMSNFDCATLSAASGRPNARGRSGRRERYSVCYRAVFPPNGGLLTLDTSTDYATQPRTYVAADASQQPAPQVWMRPPLLVRFTYRPPPGRGAPYTFYLYVMHTKPSFNGSLPAGIPNGTPDDDSVYYELRGTEQNLLGPPLNFAVLGDLNSDCLSYPPRRRGQNFIVTAPPPSPYVWLIPYGSRTNVGAEDSCAYDQVIFDPALHAMRLVRPEDSNIFKTGIGYLNQRIRLSSKVVSDHYLVWFEIGREEPAAVPSVLVAAMASLVGVGNPDVRRTFTTTGDGPRAIHVGAKRIKMSGTTGNTAKVYIVDHDQTHHMRGNARITLTDVRGEPTPVTVNSDGTLATDVVWNEPLTVGAFTMVFNARGDGIFDRFAGDFATHDDEIDFLVEGASVPHSSVVTLDDRGLAREVFNAAIAQHIYVRARGLPPNAEVNVYVVSKKRVATALGAGEAFTTWEELRNRGTLHLADVSVPVNIARDPVMISALAANDKVKTLKADSAGNLFASIWDAPANLAASRVLESEPPLPERWPTGWSQDDETHRDPCADAATEEMRRACNYGPSFYDYYGDEFSVVIDSNRNGILDGGDQFDVHDIGDMTQYFQTHAVLNFQSADNAAISEYKEYLAAKLSLFLSGDNRYGPRTADASMRYLCSPDLTREKFNAVVKPGAQIGFKVLGAETYTTYRSLGSGVADFIDGHIDMQGLEPNADLCITAEDLELDFGQAASRPAMPAQVNTVVQENFTAYGDIEASGIINAGTAGIGQAHSTRITPFQRFIRLLTGTHTYVHDEL